MVVGPFDSDPRHYVGVVLTFDQEVTMLYQIDGYDDRNTYQHTIIEAPRHRQGVLPKGLDHWLTTVWMPNLGMTEVSVCEHHAARVGYSGHNAYGVNTCAVSTFIAMVRR